MKKDERPDWERTFPLGKLIDDRPEDCKHCDYDWYEDCTKGCMKVKYQEKEDNDDME